MEAAHICTVFLRVRVSVYSATCDNSMRKKDWLALLQAWNAATTANELTEDLCRLK
jgi:hypothetical protein